MRRLVVVSSLLISFQIIATDPILLAQSWFYGPATPFSQVLSGSLDERVVVLEGQFTRRSNNAWGDLDYEFSDGSRTVVVGFDNETPSQAIPLNSTVRIMGKVKRDNGQREIDIEGLESINNLNLNTITVGQANQRREDENVVVKGQYKGNVLSGADGNVPWPSWNYYNFEDSTGATLANVQDFVPSKWVPRNRTVTLVGEMDEFFGSPEIQIELTVLTAGSGGSSGGGGNGGGGTTDPDAELELIFPQFVDGVSKGKSNSSRLILRNTGGVELSGTVRFKNSSGAPLSVSVNGESSPNHDVSIDGWGSIDVVTDAKGSLKSGVVEVWVDDGGSAGNLKGTLVVEFSGSRLSVDASPDEETYQVFIAKNSKESTGIAGYNPLADSVWRVEMILLDDKGNEKASKTVEIAPNNQFLAFIDQAPLFKSYFDSNPGDFVGTLNIRVIKGRAANLIGMLMRRSNGHVVVAPSGPSAYTP